MSYCYNDYLKLTKEYLRSLNYYREAEKNLSASLTDIDVELGGVSIKSANAADEIHGVSSELTSVERAAAYRINLENRYTEIIRERNLLRKHIDKLTRAINTLPPAEQEVIKLFFADCMSYTKISETLNYSERTIKRRMHNAIRSIAVILFGDRANRRMEFIQ